MAKREKSSRRASPSNIGWVVFALTFIAAGVLFVLNYLPYRSYKAISDDCTIKTTGTISGTLTQRKDGYYYYGPTVLYTESRGQKTVLVSALNTLELDTTWEEGQSVNIYYNPDDPSEMILADDTTAYDNYKQALTIGIVIASAGFIVLIITIVASRIMSNPKKYNTNVAGQSYDEWKEQQIKEMAQGILGVAPLDKDQMDSNLKAEGENESVALQMDDALSDDGTED